MANLDEEQAELLASLHAFTLLNGLGRGKSFYPDNEFRFHANLFFSATEVFRQFEADNDMLRQPYRFR